MADGALDNSDSRLHQCSSTSRAMTSLNSQLGFALAAANESTRLKAALAIGTNRVPELVDALVARCGIEPDFYVRDMLTWALIQFPSEIIVPKLLAELGSGVPQARSQALHTLSKIKDVTIFPAITLALLRDPDDEVARSAWRAAVVLVPDAKKAELAEELATQLGRGDGKLQLSLSRALVALGEDVALPVLGRYMGGDEGVAQAHAIATDRMLRDPDAGFEVDVQEARRQFVLGRDRTQ